MINKFGSSPLDTFHLDLVISEVWAPDNITVFKVRPNESFVEDRESDGIEGNKRFLYHP